MADNLERFLFGALHTNVRKITDTDALHDLIAETVFQHNPTTKIMDDFLSARSLSETITHRYLDAFESFMISIGLISDDPFEDDADFIGRFLKGHEHDDCKCLADPFLWFFSVRQKAFDHLLDEMIGETVKHGSD